MRHAIIALVLVAAACDPAAAEQQDMWDRAAAGPCRDYFVADPLAVTCPRPEQRMKVEVIAGDRVLTCRCPEAP